MVTHQITTTSQSNNQIINNEKNKHNETPYQDGPTVTAQTIQLMPSATYRRIQLTTTNIFHQRMYQRNQPYPSKLTSILNVERLLHSFYHQKKQPHNIKMTIFLLKIKATGVTTRPPVTINISDIKKDSTLQNLVSLVWSNHFSYVSSHIFIHRCCLS